ncbi:phage holin [Streptomyces sp. TRM76323]|uniref:Phage holin n=1 Tax=Streptomyces tamarix TaxID=3078565 RepID=A0ABU3QKX3_9ACTN|nr:phage holin [Streptomyces tamarix]MDT9683420.1 phage holin [Streptomyces tamarix]
MADVENTQTDSAQEVVSSEAPLQAPELASKAVDLNSVSDVIDKAKDVVDNVQEAEKEASSTDDDNKETVVIPDVPAKISQKTVIAVIASVVALVNAIIVMFGKTPLNITDDSIYTIGSILFLIGTSIWSLWRNNDITAIARKKADVVKQVEDKIK